jgi:drug/metabolite transporter (DMT)-like permease
MNGSVGVMVSFATMPTALLVVARMLFAGLFLSPLVLRRARRADLRARGVPLRLFIMALRLACDIILYFVAIRYAGVAAAVFLVYTAPIYVAAAAPRILHEPSDRVTYVALLLAVVGMAAIVAPSLMGGGFDDLGAVGVLAGVGSGLSYGALLLMVKSTQVRVAAPSIVWVQSLVSVVVLLPLAVYQTVVSDYALTAMDLLLSALLGLITMAIGFTLYVHGMKYIKVQHGAIMGYLEPVSAPLYALLLLGQVPSGSTVLGGALIVAAGILLVVKGHEARVPLTEGLP